LALLADKPTRVDHRSRRLQFHVPDWLPPIVNGARAFVVIGGAALFWIVTAWPAGATFMTFAAIVVILFSPNADQASVATVDFLFGTSLGTIFAAIVKFAALPGVETFEIFSLVLGLYLVPVGALLAQPRHISLFTGMLIVFVPLIAPANQMSFNTLDFYNTALAIVTGTSAAAVSFRLIPPLSPAIRARRLLAHALRDVRRLAAHPTTWSLDDWRAIMHARLAAMPEAAEPLQRSQLVVALSVGGEIIRLERVASSLALNPDLDAALSALARGDGTAASAQLIQLDRRLAADADTRSGSSSMLRARASILEILEALDQHASYFDSGGSV
jgi:uncharacterized membrane protein YccC